MNMPNEDYSTFFSADCIRKINFRPDKTFAPRLKREWQEYASHIPPYPGHFKGRGIVICAGGAAYFTCAWVNVVMLRKTGCTLPVEMWYTGKEMTKECIGAMEQLGVTCIDSLDYGQGNFQNYALKPFAILHSSFREVMYLDADNICVTDPSSLFESAPYLATGALFWPDLWKTDTTNPIWEVLGVPYTPTFEFESGQLLINKEKCWKELNLCTFFNRKREDYYKFLLGDKDTFKYAWMALKTPFHLVRFPVGFCGAVDSVAGFCGMTMVQHDLDGNVLFLHRHWIKWDITMPEELMWVQIKRFRPDARDRIYEEKHIERVGGSIKFADIRGDVEVLSFTSLLGDIELECLQALNALRNSDVFASLMLHTYFQYFRPGYANGHTSNMFNTPSVLI